MVFFISFIILIDSPSTNFYTIKYWTCIEGSPSILNPFVGT
jgi:hypothetical protein